MKNVKFAWSGLNAPSDKVVQFSDPIAISRDEPVPEEIRKAMTDGGVMTIVSLDDKCRGQLRGFASVIGHLIHDQSVEMTDEHREHMRKVGLMMKCISEVPMLPAPRSVVEMIAAGKDISDGLELLSIGHEDDDDD